MQRPCGQELNAYGSSQGTWAGADELGEVWIGERKVAGEIGQSCDSDHQEALKA